MINSLIRRLIRSMVGWSAIPRNRRERREHAQIMKRMKRRA